MATHTLVTPGLMTFTQFEQMPDDGRRYELRNGEPIEVPIPLHDHFHIQLQLRDLLAAAAGSAGRVGTEWGFRPAGEDQYLIADVAFLSRERYAAISRYLMGSPELVVEVLSPSNSASEIFEKEQLCLENGCREFWVVDPKRRVVKVSTPDGSSKTYQTGQEIPLMFGGSIELDAIFA